MGNFQTPITIFEAMNSIKDNKYLLPSFQRDFKWSSDKVELLFDSIMQGLPFSSMLFWKINKKILDGGKYYYFNENAIENPDRVRNNPYAQKECKQYPQYDELNAILDGQQRLTSIRIGLYGEYEEHPHRGSWDYLDGDFIKKMLYLNISKLGNSEETEKTYIFEFISKEKVKNNDNTYPVFYTDEKGSLWYKISDIINYNHEKVKNGLEIGDYYDGQKLTISQKGIISKLNDKIFNDKIVNFYLEDTEDVDVAVKIFSRINNGGESLSNAEIIYSIIKATWSLDARLEIPNLIECIKNKGFDIDIEYIIKAFLFLYSSNVKNEIKTFDNEFCKTIEDNWSNIKEAIKSLFDTLLTYGMSNPNLTANNATLPILYYIYHKNIYNNFATSVNYLNDRNNIKKWLYSVLLRKVFGSQGDTVLTQARNSFNPVFNSKDGTQVQYIDSSFEFLKENINKNIDKITMNVEEEAVEELLNTQKDNYFAFLILSLLFPQIEYNKGDYEKDHLHNKNSYDLLPDDVKEHYTREMYNSIVNLQMLTKNENASKQDMPLKDWVNNQCKDRDRKLFYENHLIPDVDLSLDNFAEFYDRRKELLIQKLKQLL